MILPGSEFSNLMLLVFGMLCLGTWANTFRMTGKWRFELYSFDFAVGTVVAAVLLGLTFGSLGWDGFALTDDLRIAGKQKDAFAMAAGAVFNLGNMLILGSLSVAGVTVAYMMGLGAMLTSGMVLMHFTSPSGSGALLTGGAVLFVAAAVLLGFSSKLNSTERLVALIRQGKTKSTKKTVSLKGFFLAMGGGIIAGGYFPLVQAAGSDENGLGPYALGLFFTIGVFVSTLVFGLFFMNLPITGEPLEPSAYFKGRAKFHWLGVLGGIVWYVGLSSTLIAARAEGSSVIPPVTGRAVLLCAAVVGTLWGLLRWREFDGASSRIKTLLASALLVFAVGIVGLSFAAGNYLVG